MKLAKRKSILEHSLQAVFCGRFAIVFVTSTYTKFSLLLSFVLSPFFRELNSNTIESLQNDGEKSRAQPCNQRHSVSVSWNVLNLGFICQAYLWTWSVWQKVRERESERCRAKITNSRNILLSDNNASLVCIVRFAVDLSLLCRVLFFWLECRLNKRAKSCKQTEASKKKQKLPNDNRNTKMVLYSSLFYSAQSAVFTYHVNLARELFDFTSNRKVK